MPEPSLPPSQKMNPKLKGCLIALLILFLLFVGFVALVLWQCSHSFVA